MQILQSPFNSSGNLLSYYRCESNGNDEKSSINLSTTSGINPLSFSSGKYGNAFDCDSYEAKAYSTSSYNIGGSSFTISFWAQLVSAVDSNGLFFSMSNSANDIAIDIRHEYNAGSPRLFWKRSRNGISTPDLTYSWTPIAGRFYHIGMVYDATNIYGYLDGVQVASTATSGNGNNGSGDFIEICRQAGTLRIKMDDIAIFDTWLTELQMRQIYLDAGGYFLYNIL